MIYLVFKRVGFDFECILATKDEDYAKRIYESIHDMDDTYIESIELEKIKDV